MRKNFAEQMILSRQRRAIGSLPLANFYNAKKLRRTDERQGIFLKLDYFDLLSPKAVYLKNIGGIISPKLRDIASVGIHTYQHYLSILLMDIKTYFSLIGQEEQFLQLSEEEKTGIHIFDLLTANRQTAALLQDILNFFIEEEVTFLAEQRVFLIQNGDTVIGTISTEEYPTVCDIICQRCCITSHAQEDLSKIKSKKALEILKKIRKGRSENAHHTKADANMELGNIISAVANKSHSLNIINIWNLTVYQIWDCFSRLSNNSIYDIQSMSVAAWGNKDNHFDAASWFKRI